ncbi:MAG: DsbC family protein [Halothiobacillaceae bacterium]
MTIRSLAIAGLLAGLVAPLQADETAIRESVERNMPGVQIDELVPTPVDGLYELRAGSDIVYITEDGKHLFTGSLIDLPARANLTESTKAGMRAEFMETLDESDMIVFEAEGERRHQITVLTDHTCPYCSRLHDELEDLTAAGVEVRYLLTPRQGEQAPAFKEASMILCAEDRVEAVDTAMRTKEVKGEACANDLVREHMQVAERMGMSGTPFIITASGMTIPGYRPAADLVRLLDAAP